jgi:hypothetical protein
MRRNTTLALAFGLLASVAVFVGIRIGPRDGVESTLATSAAAPGAVETSRTLDAELPADIEARASSTDAAVRSEVVTAASARAKAAPCVVFGRLVDELGAPLEGAAVRLFAYREWAEGLDVPRLAGRDDERGFETTTQPSGEFRITVPVPTVERTALSIRPDRFHDSVTLLFAAAGDRALPALESGERDLGELRVASTGALTGRVLDAQGQPVAHVEMGIGEPRDTSFERDVRTDSDGRYLIPHAPVGTYGVRAKSKQHLDVFEPGVVVVAGVDTVVRDLVLVTAPTLAGTVVDEHGQPLERVRIVARSLDDGSASIGESEPDGRFAVSLRQNAAHTLAAERDGYLRWGDPNDRSTSYEPGRRDIAVVLQTLPRVQFKVVDADAGVPIERFGLEVRADDSSLATRTITGDAPRPRHTEHPGGIVETGARAGIDIVAVEAAECVPWIGRVRFDTPGVPLQTVRLSRGAGISGRTLRAGAPLADTLVEAVRITAFALNEDGNYDAVRHHVDGDTRRGARTDSEGRFRVGALQGGEYRLTVRPNAGAPYVLAPVHVRPRATTDVGDLDVVAGGTIVGELLPPSGFDPAGLRVFLDDPDDGVTALVDGAGRFRFENVPAGVRFVGYEPRAGALARRDPARVELAAGETRTLTIDARDRAMCAVELHVDLGELSPAGAEVQLIPADGAGRSESLGTCDATGRVRGAVRAFGTARVGVDLPGVGGVRHPSAVLELVPFGHVDAAVKFEFARLALRVRGALPRDGRVTVRLAPGSEHLAPQSVTLRFANGSAVAETAALSARADGVSIGGLVAGWWTVTVEIFTDDPPPAPGESPRTRSDGEPTYTASQQIELKGGETLALEL